MKLRAFTRAANHAVRKQFRLLRTISAACLRRQENYHALRSLQPKWLTWLKVVIPSSRNARAAAVQFRQLLNAKAVVAVVHVVVVNPAARDAVVVNRALEEVVVADKVH